MSFRSRTTAALVFTAFFAATAHSQDRNGATVSFERDVKPIFRKRCANCHNPERPRGELDLTTFPGVVAGGASGKAAIAGNADESPIYTQVAHLEDPKMPPNAPKIPQREIDVIRRWVEEGMIERAGDSTARNASGPDAASASVTLVAPEITPRGTAISALAVSPIAPIGVVSGHRQILVFDLTERKLSGALPFPEGDVFVLRFSRDGQSLLAAGGVGAESGKVVLFQTKTWARVRTLGDEVDAVLAADLSVDSSRVVVGGPTRAVKLFANPGGETVQTFRKPTDWVTAAAFSPDGLLVAASDRFGGLFLWETRSGQEFLTLRGHPKAITSIAWNAEGDNLVTAGEDGGIQVWDLHRGKATDRWDAHDGGVLSIDVHPSGRIVSGGRDRRVKVWERGGGGKLASDLGPSSDQTTRVAWSADGRSVVSGDLSGEVRVWNPADSTFNRLPMPVAAKPAAVVLVAPVLTPARRFTPKPVAVAANPSRPDARTTPGDDLKAALGAAKESATAAERTVAALARLAAARSARSDANSPSDDNALNAAKAAVTALKAALDSEPGDIGLTRALAETERAVTLLERKRGRVSSAGHTTDGGR